MADPIGTASGIVTIAQGAMQFLDYVKGLTGSDVISTLFKWDASRIDGSDRIKVNIQFEENKIRWWYWVSALEDYTFVRFPVVESCLVEVPGMNQAVDKMHDAQYWRWVPQVIPGRIYGGESSNIKVDFIVIGYRPKAILKHFSK